MSLFPAIAAKKRDWKIYFFSASALGFTANILMSSIISDKIIKFQYKIALDQSVSCDFSKIV